MEEWKEYKLIDVCKVINGRAYKQEELLEEGKYRVLRVGNIFQGNNWYYSDIELPEDKYCYNGDLLYAWSCGFAPYIWKGEKTIYHYHIWKLKECKEVVDRKFLYYYLIVNTKRFLGGTHGSVMLHLTKREMEEQLLRLPSLSTQQHIASILNSLDDKIEVNRRINKNLEQQAQALFKSWFVDFEPFKNGEFVESELGMIPKGWRVVSLDEMTSKFGTGLNPRKNFKLGEGNNYYVTIKNMGKNRVYLDERCDKVTDEAIEKINKRSKLQAGDLLFSGIGTIGRVALITETPTNWNTSESVFNMHPADNISSEFLYVLLLSDVFQQYVKLHAQGGVQQGIRMASLKEYKMAIPDDNILHEFDKKVIPLVSLVKKTDDETDRLATLRDTLLPKLMSGELKVGDVTL